MDRFGGPGAALWARLDLRRRWVSLVVLGVLAGLSTALAIAALSGARRADTAFARLTEATTAADAVVFPSQVSDQGTFDWDDLRAVDYVEDVAPWSLVFGTLFPDSEAPEPQTVFFLPVDDHWGQTTDRPLVREGRMWDPEADSEVVVDEPIAEEFGVQIGDILPIRVYETGQFATGDPAGPTLDLEVVGIVRETSQFLFTEGTVILSPGTLAAHPEMERIENADVRLREPVADIAALRRDVDDVVTTGTPVLDLHSVLRRVGTAITVERIAQQLLGLAVAAAALVFVGQALARSVGQIDDDAVVLRALGLTRRQRTAAATAPHLLTLAVALPVALLGAWFLADRFPIGYARAVDPDVGHHIDWVVAGPTLLAAALLLGLGAYLIAWSHNGRLGLDEPSRPSAVAAAVRSRAPLPVGLGTTMAFEPGKGRRRVPVGPALLGAVAGILGIVGTLTVDHGLQDAITHPERAGVTWDATVTAGPSDIGTTSNEVSSAFLDDLGGSDDVVATAVIGRAVLPIDGVGIAVFDVQPAKGDLDLVVVEGDAPRGDDEVAIGPATARQLGVGIGDEVTVDGVESATLRVVGLALFPHDVHSGFTEGAWVTPAVLATVGQPFDYETQTGTVQMGALRWADGVDPEAAFAALQERLGNDERFIAPAEIPPELVNLERVRSVPLILVGFLVVLAISALGHVLITSARRRRRDFAVLRSIGFTRRQTATVVVAHSTSVGLVGLLVGIPIGIALGRLAWGWVADTVPLVHISPVALVATLVTIPIALAVTNAIAAYPARRIARLGAAEALRTE